MSYSNLPVDPNKDAVPIRLFKSDFLEFFTHISPATITGLWLPVIVLFLVVAVVKSTEKFPLYIPVAFLVGMFLWTFVEYLMHRFVFHHTPTTPWQERLIFLFHGIHHAQPQVKTRLVMPFAVTIPMFFVFYGLFDLILAKLFYAPQWILPLMAGLTAGYLAYDLLHYATHHWAMRRGPAKALKRYHMLHHYKDPQTRFGVSSPVWDHVFGTTGGD